MDFFSAMFILAFIGIAVMPVWTEWIAERLSRSLQGVSLFAAVVALSLVSFLIVSLGPFVAVAVHHGTIDANLADTMLPVALLMVFGLPAVLQLGSAVDFTNKARARRRCAQASQRRVSDVRLTP